MCVRREFEDYIDREKQLFYNHVEFIKVILISNSFFIIPSQGLIWLSWGINIFYR